MIIKWLLDGLTFVVTGVLGSLPKIPVPGWFKTDGGNVGVVFKEASSMGVWIPIDLALTIGAVMITCLLMGATIKVARIVLSLVSAGGGSAA